MKIATEKITVLSLTRAEYYEALEAVASAADMHYQIEGADLYRRLAQQLRGERSRPWRIGLETFTWRLNEASLAAFDTALEVHAEMLGELADEPGESAVTVASAKISGAMLAALRAGQAPSVSTVAP